MQAADRGVSTRTMSRHSLSFTKIILSQKFSKINRRPSLSFFAQIQFKNGRFQKRNGFDSRTEHVRAMPRSDKTININVRNGHSVPNADQRNRLFSVSSLNTSIAVKWKSDSTIPDNANRWLLQGGAYRRTGTE